MPRLEGCHSKFTGERKRSDVPTSYFQDGWTKDGRRNMVEHKSRWSEESCGYLEKGADPACTGCFNRHEGE